MFFYWISGSFRPARSVSLGSARFYNPVEMWFGGSGPVRYPVLWWCLRASVCLASYQRLLHECAVCCSVPNKTRAQNPSAIRWCPPRSPQEGAKFCQPASSKDLVSEVTAQRNNLEIPVWWRTASESGRNEFSIFREPGEEVEVRLRNRKVASAVLPYEKQKKREKICHPAHAKRRIFRAYFDHLSSEIRVAALALKIIIMIRSFCIGPRFYTRVLSALADKYTMRINI